MTVKERKTEKHAYKMHALYLFIAFIRNKMVFLSYIHVRDFCRGCCFGSPALPVRSPVQSRNLMAHKQVACSYQTY